MIRWIVGRVLRLTAIGLLATLLGLTGLALYTQYVFQESFYTTWSRLLRPQIAWQKGKYPSARPLFDLAEGLLADSDPRDRFGPVAGAAPPARPGNWPPGVVGPDMESAPADGRGGASPGADAVSVATPRELTAAIEKAAPGTVITVLPGLYRFDGHSIDIRPAGTPDNPIVLRATRLGAATFHFNLLEGLHVQGAYWRFENLLIEGVCASDSRCEHAFHVVGGAAGVIIRNNWVANFNSPVKVNGSPKGYPDNGAILRNAFVNDRPRQTDNPVTFLDIVAANGWVVDGNFIADFAKALGNRVSYGAFFKGAGADNIFERNLVRCEWRHRGGIRIGLSFGGGGTTGEGCRGGSCSPEHTGGILRSNIVMDCPNDVGVYLNQSARTTIHNNLIVNTRGVDVRFATTDATIFNNVIDGRILGREDARYSERDNRASLFAAMLNRRISDRLFANAAAGYLRTTDPAALVGASLPAGEQVRDFCGRPFAEDTGIIGPFQYGPNLGCAPILP